MPFSITKGIRTPTCRFTSDTRSFAADDHRAVLRGCHDPSLLLDMKDSDVLKRFEDLKFMVVPRDY